MKTTNYYDTFIEVADDCPAKVAEVPPEKGGEKTVANLQYEMISGNPYEHTSDDVLFHVYAVRNNIARRDLAKAREAFFSKDQACLRSSPLTKRYGWGVHSDAEGRIALVPVGTAAYTKLATDKDLAHLTALRSRRA